MSMYDQIPCSYLRMDRARKRNSQIAVTMTCNDTPFILGGN